MSFEDFFIENVEANEEVEVTFKRFKQPFKIKALNADEVADIKKECTKTVAVAGKKGRFTKELDVDKFNGMFVCKSVTYPDLNNTDLQNNYKVYDAFSLVRKMLLSGEFDELTLQCQTLSGYDLDNTQDMVDEAKN